MKHLFAIVFFACGALIANTSVAETIGWPMISDGRFPAAKPPVEWSDENNVVWKTALPATSNASPLLIQEKSTVVVLNEPDQIIALDSTSGAITWSASVADVSDSEPGAHRANGWTSATPVTDGERVFAVFGNGVVAAYTLDGKRLWARLVQAPKHRWGHSASPVLVKDRLVVHMVDLFGLDAASGNEVWKQTSEVNWGSPVTAQVGQADVVLTSSGDVFATADGAPVATGIGSVQYSTPIVLDGIIYFIEKRATAVRIPDQIDAPFEQIWESRLKGSRHYASPLVHDGRIYAVSRELDFSILDRKTGEVVHEQRLDLDSGSNTGYPSISLGGDRVYLSTENGTTAVLETGSKYVEVARNSIEGFRSSPVFSGERMFVRSFGHLYCFGR